jgi:RNA polymerase sigma-70 factor (ECF subfamily)
MRAPSRIANSMDLESSVELLRRIKAGEEAAVGRLLDRYIVPLRRWAHGRLPVWARDLSDTQDVVQDALLKALRHLDHFQPTGPGALHGYLRQAVWRRILDEIRRAKRRPTAVELDHEPAAEGPGPLERLIGREALGSYKQALTQLREDDRELIIARVEGNASYEELAAMFDKPTAAAARTAVRRALLKLAVLMQRPDVMGAGG